MLEPRCPKHPYYKAVQPPRVECADCDLISNFLYYDRKEDEGLYVGKIEDLIKRGVITQKWIVDRFAKELKGAIR